VKFHFDRIVRNTEYGTDSLCVFNKHPMGCEAQLAWKCLFMPTFWWAILTR